MSAFKKYIVFIFAMALLSSCNHDFRHIGFHTRPRPEFAPNMYYSEAYEPYNQITDSVNYPEDYNSNPYNPFASNLRHPVKGTINRNSKGILPLHITIDDLETTRNIPNPLPASEEVLAEGQVLFLRYCSPCHGEGGQGDGKVGEVYGGVPNFTSDAMKNLPSGHIYHVITFGRNRMTSYATQVSQEDRWKIAHFVHTLQKAE